MNYSSDGDTLVMEVLYVVNDFDLIGLIIVYHNSTITITMLGMTIIPSNHDHTQYNGCVERRTITTTKP